MTTRRRKLTLSLRALLLVVLAFGLWLGWRVDKARNQRLAVAAIREYGGEINYDWEYVGDVLTPGRQPLGPKWLRRMIGDEYFQEVAEVNLLPGTMAFGKGMSPRPERAADEVIPRLRAFPALKRLSLNGNQATDRAMETIGSLGDLEDLWMGEAYVTDAGFARLKRLKRLKYLHIDNLGPSGDGPTHLGPGLSDESLRVLKALPRLESLSLQGHRFTDGGFAHLGEMTGLKSLVADSGITPITDAALVHLKRLKKLEVLGLQATGITDAGLEELTGLTSLKELWVSGSRVTPEGIERLEARMPKLKTVLNW